MMEEYASCSQLLLANEKPKGPESAFLDIDPDNTLEKQNSSQRNQQKTFKLGYLEGLRGIAAFSVTVWHFNLFLSNIRFERVREYFGPHQLLYLLINGEFAVAVFFILSGRVLSTTILKMKPSQQVAVKIGSSIAKRAIRLGFPMIAAVLVQQLLLRLGAYWAQPLVIQHGGDWWYHPPQSISSLEAFFRFVSSFATATVPYENEFYIRKYTFPGVIWTMPVEFSGSMFTYVLCSVLVNVSRPKRRYLVLVITAILLGLVRNANMLSFLLGMALTQMSLDGTFTKLTCTPKNGGLKKGWLLWVVRFGLIGFAAVSCSDDAAFIPVKQVLGSRYRYVAGGFCICLLFEITSILQKMFSSYILLFLGKISFGLYLTHGIILGTICPIWCLCLEKNGVAYQKLITWTCFPLYIYLSICLGYVSMKLLDIPSTHLADSFQKYLFADHLEPLSKERSCLSDITSPKKFNPILFIKKYLLLHVTFVLVVVPATIFSWTYSKI